MNEITWEEKIKYAVNRVAERPELEDVVVESIIGTIKPLIK